LGTIFANDAAAAFVRRKTTLRCTNSPAICPTRLAARIVQRRFFDSSAQNIASAASLGKRWASEHGFGALAVFCRSTQALLVQPAWFYGTLARDGTVANDLRPIRC
jgi:hypothetical protein